jgi:hypothetical protein
MPTLPPGYTIEPGTGAVVPIRRRNMTKRRFMGRLPVAEYTALNLVRIAASTPEDVKAGLMTLAELRDMSDDINLDDDDTQYGVAVSINVLVSLPEGAPGRIPVEQASARVDAWLADYPQPGEPFP